MGNAIYQEFLASKTVTTEAAGLARVAETHPMLFPFQRDIVRWALKKGRAAIFADCGMGKSFMQLEWARQVPGRTLILAPLAVAPQTVREAAKLDIDLTYSRHDTGEQMVITNYEMLDYFNPADFAGIVLDESSILKSYDGKFRNQIITSFLSTPYRLACTATPAPNDFMELGNHSEFLGSLTRTEMLSTFFVHDGGDTAKWRLKGHAGQDFWKWVCSWAVTIRKPSDLGYDDAGFILPELNIQQHTVESNFTPPGMLFALEAQTLQDRQKARSSSTDERARMLAEIVAQKPDEPWLIWCNLNVESEAAAELIPDAIELRGSDAHGDKEQKMLAFSDGKIRVLVTKPSIAGFGMNWQHCPNVAFLGLSDSYEQFYQAIRRCWRFGQKREVNCHIITSTAEGAVVENVRRKEQDATQMALEMVKHMHTINEAEIKGTVRKSDDYKRRTERGDSWTMHLGDCVEGLKEKPDNSVHYSIFSPPFASLYTYSASERDMGNCRSHSEFYDHFSFIVAELFRVTMPGRLLSFHCTNIPTMKERDGVIGISDFRGALINMFVCQGFIYHSEVTIWKDPVTAMQRTKALGLLHKQLKKDSCMSRQGIPDYLVTVRKPGVNPEPVSHTNETFPVQVWQRYASPVWMDIDPSNTLQKESAREDKDERHICPLQLDVIERAIRLWSNEDDLIISPFAGIGSEGHQAVKMGRRFEGWELKESYFKQAAANLKAVEVRSVNMFSTVTQPVQSGKA